ncbi:MAG: DHHA1 domain-containing protein [Candidatus Helarchaeota archaeon]
MIVTHKDADGFSAAGILILARNDMQESLENLRYATVSYINKLLYKLRRRAPQELILIDINADDSEKYTKNLIFLANRGVSITLYDHHQFPNDDKLIQNNINVVRDTTISATELIYKNYIDKIKGKHLEKANFLLALGSIGDRIVTPFAEKIISRIRRETLFDVYACLMSGMANDKKILKSLFYERDKDGVGFTKKLYKNAVNRRYTIEDIKKYILKNQIIYKNVRLVHIYYQNIGFASSFLIEQPNTDISIAIGDGSLPLRILIKLYAKKFLSFGLNKELRDLMLKDTVRISFRSKRTKKINEIVEQCARIYGGVGGGHSNACGATIPKKSLEQYLKNVIQQFMLI